ncbi:MAG: hypothetical protein SGI74_09600 [Oligoflexia bacterium]|nr:hypothetical protein [Oligoflexia bacterium]
MNLFSKGAFLALALTVSINAQANTLTGDQIKELSFDPPTITEVEPMQIPSIYVMKSVQTEGEGDGINIGDIVNAGKFIWEIIKAGQPVANMTSDVAHALPRGSEGWQSLSAWSLPQAKAYNVVYKNKFGKEVVNFTYQVFYTFNGGVRGAGKFLANITAIPTHIKVASWGYSLNASAQVRNATNIGTDDHPVALLPLVVSWRLNTMIQAEVNTKSYTIQGDGVYLEQK